MTADQLATVIEAGIGVLIGAYVTLLGYRVVGKKQGEDLKYDEWHQRYGAMFRALGPLIAASAVVVAVVRRIGPAGGG